MPLFEFVCRQCDDQFEELVRSASSVGEVTCPSCSSEHVEKKLSTFVSRITGSSSFSTSASTAAACSTGSI